MDAFIKFLTEHATPYSITTIYVLAAFNCISFVLKPELLKIFIFFFERKDKEHELAKALLESKILSPESRKFLREHLERLAFKKYRGIDTDDEMRTALLAFYEKNKRFVTWQEIKQAFPKISLVNCRISAHLTKGDHVYKWFNTVLGYASLISCVVFAVLAIYTLIITKDTQGSLRLAIEFLSMFISAVVFGSQNWSYYSTRKIIQCSESDDTPKDSAQE